MGSRVMVSFGFGKNGKSDDTRFQPVIVILSDLRPTSRASKYTFRFSGYR